MKTAPELRKTVCVSTYSRATMLRECLQSILLAKKDLDISLLVLVQGNNPEVWGVVDEFKSSIDFLLTKDGENLSPLQNINLNRISCYEYCFEVLNNDYVVAIEDDCIIAPDSLNFVESVMAGYIEKILFRGVNLGSKEIDCDIAGFTKLRFGLMGQAGAITRRTWNHFDVNKLKTKSLSKPFDSLIESYLKRGYMVTPNRSRMIDRGWQGTHFHTIESDPHFVAIQRSWLSEAPSEIRYKEYSIRHSWRSDARVFRLVDQPIYVLKSGVAFLIQNRAGKKLINTIRTFIGLAKYD